MQTKTWYWPEKGPWFLLLSGATAALWFQLRYHTLLGPDWLSYVDVAELYAAGKFHNAINGYWSPLYSWIIALFIKLDMRPHVTTYCINIAAAMACFYFMQQLGRRYLTNTVVYILFQLSTVVVLLYCAVAEITPDLMATAATLWFLTILSNPAFYSSYRLPLWAGIAGATMFLAKSYNFLFLHLFYLVWLTNALRSSAKRKEGCYRTIGMSLLVFWCVSLVWIIPLSIHEGRPTFSTAGSYSHNYAGPGHPGHPILQGVIAPPFEEAHTAWFDPSRQLDDRPWSCFESLDNMLYQLRHIAGNAIVVVKILNRWYLRADLLLLCILLLAWCDKKRWLDASVRLKLWWLVILIYPIGYLPFFVEGRYIYVEVLLILFFFFYLLQEIGYWFSASGKKRKLFNALTLTTMLLFILTRSLALGRQQRWIYHSSSYFQAVKSRTPYLQNQRIISDESCYPVATQLCYTTQARLYGVWQPTELAKVKQYNIQYLLAAVPHQEAFLRLSEVVPAWKGNIYVYQFIFNESK